MNSKKWGMALLILLLLTGGAGAYYAFRTDPALAAALDLQKQMRNEDLPREDRRKLFGQMREAMDNLTPEQRHQVFQQMGRGPEGWMAREKKRMDDFLALSKKDQVKALDKDIDEMVKRRKDWEKRQKEREKERAAQAAQGGGANGGSGSGGANGGNNNNNNNNNSGQGGQGGGRGGNGGGGGDRGQQRRLALDNSSARQQAQGSEYRRMLGNRMQQRGIPNTGGGGRRGGF
jgi:hypothetical protein